MAEAIIVSLYFYDFSIFINLQVAVVSSFLIITATTYTYKNMVKSKVKKGEYEEDKDPLDKIDDPYELYDEDKINDAPIEQLDIKQIIKDEKSKIKTLSLSSMKFGAFGAMSLYRIAGYAFLALGFIALKNNHLLNLNIYLPSLALGVVLGYFFIKGLNDKRAS